MEVYWDTDEQPGEREGFLFAIIAAGISGAFMGGLVVWVVLTLAGAA